MKHFTFLALLILFITAGLGFASEIQKVEQWGLFELVLKGPDKGNPFKEIQLSVVFTNGDHQFTPQGFYDGAGDYKIRFMPNKTGTWHYRTQSNDPQLDNQTGSFDCMAPSEKNHGPVEVHHTFHFYYADGTPYRQIGTTCYAWVHQGEALEEQTLKTLSTSPFNKIRMCVFPKDYVYNKNEPAYYPFIRSQDGENDYTQFDPKFFAHFEERVKDLMELGIEADIILFHPYDRWGYAKMDADTDDFYLSYVVRRLSAFRNVWWSLANEFDLMESKTMDDWDRFFKIVVENDPYGHLRSVHNCREFYDYAKAWVTHCSIQSSDFSQMDVWQQRYQKPILFDECRYEGNVPQGWGNISAQEMSHRFWLGSVAGCYVGHGETYLHPADILWWSKGGVLHGESPARIAFLKKFLEEAPVEGITRFDQYSGGKAGDYYLYYFGKDEPVEWTFELPPYRTYQVEIIDTWEMTVKKLAQPFTEAFKIALPGKTYIAVRIQRVGYDFPIAPVEMSFPGEWFYKQAVVELRQRDNFPIFFTLDGSIPTQNSPLYRQPIKITDDNTTLKAITISPHEKKSRIEKRTFKKAELHQTQPVADLKNGLTYRYYEGEWEFLPDFNILTSIKTGTTAQIDISLRNQDDNFGFVFEGFIEIPEDDVYTFATSSDDGSRIYIDGKMVVDNDGQHAPLKRSGQIGLAKGFHRIKITFFELAGGEELDVYWANPEMAEQRIPAKVLFSE